MHISFSVMTRNVFSRVAFFLFLSTLAITLQAQTPAPGQSAADQFNLLAHHILDVGVKANALAGNDLKPWHLKIDYQMQGPGSPKPLVGTVEEWHAGQYQWRRNFTGPAGMGLNGTLWRVSEVERYETKAERDLFGRRLVTEAIARPVIDPLYLAPNIRPEYKMDGTQVKAESLMLNCISVVNPGQYMTGMPPDWLFPTMCFDSDNHLRAINSGNTSVQFDDLQPFQNRTVARDVKVIVDGHQTAEMKVSVLEPWDGADTSLLKPAKNAVVVPYEVEPGHPQPESIHEVAAHLPLLPIKTANYDRVVTVSILIRKDGSVKAERAIPNFMALGAGLQDSVEMAVNQWKYKPYLVNGQPVEVRSFVVYPLDTKFVPSYERNKQAR